AHLEIVAHRAKALRPREVILELTLDLYGRLRRVDALSDGNARGINDGRVVGVGRDRVLEVRVLEEELIQFIRAHLPRMASEEGVVVVRDRAEGGRSNDRAGAVF